MFQPQYISLPSFDIDTSIVENIFSTIAKQCSLSQNGVVTIVFVDDATIQNLNHTYRQKDSVTDVLSFHYFDDFSEVSSEDIAGELIFCESKILSQAQEYGLGNQKEFYKLLIHSILHLLGYDHEEEADYEVMQKLEDQIALEIFREKLA